MTCPICGQPVSEGHGRRYCGPGCRKAAERQRLRDRRVEEFTAAAAGIPRTGDRAELLALLRVSAELGSVSAMRLLLEELRRGGGGTAPDPSIIDELAARRGDPR